MLSQFLRSVFNVRGSANAFQTRQSHSAFARWVAPHQSFVGTIGLLASMPVAWRSPDPSLSNLLAVIQPHWSAIMATGGWDYPSLCMKKGIQPDKLVKASAVVMGCMQLDPRGGYIRQKDAFQVIWQIVLMPQHQLTFEAIVLPNNSHQ